MKLIVFIFICSIHLPSAGVITIFADPPPPSQDTCFAFAGRDTALCVGLNGLDTFYLGGTPVVTGGNPPYTYTWSGQYDYLTLHYTASDILDDTTAANPRLLFSIEDPLTFRLDVTDSLGNTCHDSVTISFSQFGWTLDVKEAIIMQGDSVQLYLSIFGGIPPFSYLWSPAAGLTDPTDPFTWASPDTTTRYYMVVTDAAGCTGDDDFNVIVNPSALDDQYELNERIVLRPNPAWDELMLEIKSQEMGTTQCEIIDLNGITVFSQSLETNKPVHMRIDGFSPGMYFIKVYLGGYVGVGRFLKME